MPCPHGINDACHFQPKTCVWSQNYQRFPIAVEKGLTILSKRKNKIEFDKIKQHTLDAKKGSSVTLDCTNEHSTTSGTPLSPFKQASANMAPA